MKEKKMTVKVTWNDLHSATFKELKKTYRLNDMQLENHVRKHMDGANPQERRDLYKTVWDKKNDR
jgi:hypothetical protein